MFSAIMVSDRASQLPGKKPAIQVSYIATSRNYRPHSIPLGRGGRGARSDPHPKDFPRLLFYDGGSPAFAPEVTYDDLGLLLMGGGAAPADPIMPSYRYLTRPYRSH